MKTFKMPSLGADMNDGTLVAWLKAPGDKVSRGDIVAVVETVKGAIEIECFDEGVLTELVVEPGATVQIGEILAYLNGVSKEDDASVIESVVEPARVAASIEAPAALSTTLSRRVSPAARKRAEELGVDVSLVNAGPQLVIGIAEVEAAAVQRSSAQAEAPTKRKRDPGAMRNAMRQAIGRAMARSKREIPHYYVSSTIDVSVFQQWFEAANEERTVADRMLSAAPLLKAVAIALKHVPALNGTYEDDVHRPSSDVHVGVATAIRGGGLVAPAIHDADQLSPDEVMKRLRDLVARVRAGRMRGTEMSDPTVTLSILGEGTADSLNPVIYPPQVAIIGCGAIRRRPWIVDGAIAVRNVMSVTVAGDHRVSDGRAAARFLNRLDAILQEPNSL
jgi:pyruvate dehydrogenase E2 component (dihydrolipoyllysine-residue acetyltransferase)